nr:DNA polymerase III subunit alpha [bacterium]
YGVVDFYNACKKEGIKPILGIETYVTQGAMQERPATGGQRDYAHLVLLAQNETGYRNLVKLSSLAFTEGFYYRPRIDYEVLSRHTEGVICLSACIAGDIPRLLLEGRQQEAEALARRLADMFGPGHFYIEIQDHGLPEQKRVLPMLVELAHKLGLPLAATNDVHYTLKEDAEAQDVLMCIQTGKTVDDVDRMRMETQEFYLKSPQEMERVFAAWPEAVSNTDKIADMCAFDFVFGKIHLPHFDIPEGYDGAPAYLRALCEEGLKRRYGTPSQEAWQRLEYELSTIIQMGYADYYLIVWDFVHFAKQNGIMVGPGRGSGAGSLCAYALQITDVDPLKYQLLFERFLNPERVSMPDFDIDFCYERRQEVIDYVIGKYGEDRVCQIITFGTMAARAVIRDVGRALNMPYGDVDRIAKMVPMELNMTLDKALQKNPELAQAARTDEGIGRLISLAKRLEGLPRHASTHAAGVVISAVPVTDLVPLQKNDDAVTTQFPMTTIEKLGLLKMDFLGLRTLTVLRDCERMAKDSGVDIPALSEIPFDDPEVFAMISSGDTDGVFQLESEGMRNFMRDLKPTSLEDIIAGISLYRPGPMQAIPRYVAGKRDPSSVTYAHPIMEKALSVTYGCMVYQEQVMQIVRDMAGYTLGRSDLVRRAMAKKHRDEMERERDVFIHGLVEDGKVIVPGCVRNGIPEEIAIEVFDQITAFAEYAFNKAHATGYAVIAYQTAYLKAHCPVAFMAGLLNSVAGNAGKVAQYINYCRQHGIDILPPDVNHSISGFSVEKNAIRFGLGALRNVGSAAVEQVIRERASGGPYTGLVDFCERADQGQLNRRMLESLILSGAFDFTGMARARMMGGVETVLGAAQAARKTRESGQMSLFGEEEAAPPVAFPDIPEYSEMTRLAYEKEMTGIYITGHPLEGYADALKAMDFNTLAVGQDEGEGEEGGTSGLEDGRQITMGALVASAKMKATRNNAIMGFATLEDLYGQIEALIFPAVWKRVSTLCEAGTAVGVRGKLSVREDESPKILVDEMWELGTAPPRAGRGPAYALDALPPSETVWQAPSPITWAKVYIRIAPGGDIDAFEQAKPALSAHPGQVPVYVHVADTRQTYRVEDAWRCDATDELIDALAGLYG